MPKSFTFRPRKRPKGEGCHIYPFIHVYIPLPCTERSREKRCTQRFISKWNTYSRQLGNFFYYRCSKNTKGNLVSNFSLKVKVININILCSARCLFISLVLSFFLLYRPCLHILFIFCCEASIRVCMGFFFVKPGHKMWTLWTLR